MLLITTFSFAKHIDRISEIVFEKFEARYPCIDAELPLITPSSRLPLGFEEYELLEVKLKQNKLRKRKGSFKAVFKTKKKDKNIYFKFDIDASIDVFKAKHQLLKDKIITQSDYERVTIKIDKLPPKIITCDMPKKLMVKNRIKENSFLTINKFSYKKDVLRGTHVRAYIKDGALALETEATLLEDGDIGDRVKIKTDSGKLFRAELISKYKVMIEE